MSSPPLLFRIELRRGLKANLPTNGLLSEPYFCTDTGELFVWNGSAMIAVSGTGPTGATGPPGPAPSGTPNQVVATDSSGSATHPAALRALVAADIPALPESKITSLVSDLAAKSAITYVDTQVAAEATARTSGDTAAIATAHSYTDSAIAVETSRATTAEALLSPIANPINTGSEELQNPTPATSTVAQSSPISTLSGRYWNGSASAVDKWTFQVVLANGTNGASRLTIAHTGSTGFADVSLPTIKPLGSSTPIIGDSANGIAVFGGAVGLLSGGTAYAMFGNGGGLTVVGTMSMGFASGGNAYVGADSGISRGGAKIIRVGNGGAGDVTGTIQSAEQDVMGANGEKWIFGQASELLTLSTSGATTDTAANLLPANAIIESVVARVTTAITTATDWKLGDATTPGRFSAANSTMTLGATQVGLVHVDQTAAAGPRQTAAAKVRVTTTGTPGAGAIRITVFYRQFVAPTS